MIIIITNVITKRLLPPSIVDTIIIATAIITTGTTVSISGPYGWDIRRHH